MEQEKRPVSTSCKHGPEARRAVIAAHAFCIFALNMVFATVCKCDESAIQHGLNMVQGKKR
jgi:hypothetical protein